MSPESAGERTEKATPKKREDARKDGQVLKSNEINTAILLLSLFAAIRILGGYMFEDITKFVNKYLNVGLAENPKVDAAWINNAFGEAIVDFLLIVGPVFLVAVAVGFIVNVAQVGFMITPKVIMPKLGKINPGKGFKRIFSIRSMVEMLKTIGKVVIIGIVVYQEYTGKFAEFPNLMSYDLATAGRAVTDMCMSVALKTGIAFFILGVFDYLYQWWEYEKSLKMTKQEIKEENKLLEGDPKIKSRIREKQRQMAMSRMIQAVPKADMVITNPTHYAIALKYEESSGKAPVCVAKGKDYMAQRIKNKAKEHNVEIVENKPLAQALYIAVDIGDEIPEDMFAAVAEVLAYIYAKKNPRPRTQARPGAAGAGTARI